MRDKLIKLIASKICSRYRKDTCLTKWSSGCDECEGSWNFEIGDFADYLLAEGVIVPPCKVNQFVYVVDRADIRQPIKEKIVLEIQCGYSGDLIVLQDTPFRLRRAYNFGDFGKTVFLTKAEAERALAERRSECEYIKCRKCRHSALSSTDGKLYCFKENKIVRCEDSCGYAERKIGQ